MKRLAFRTKDHENTSWCGPCLDEFPHSNKLREEFPEVEFIYICIESDKKRFENTIKRFQLGGHHYFLNSMESERLRNELNIDGIPRYLVIDRTGTVLDNGTNLHPGNQETKKEMLRLIAVD